MFKPPNLSLAKIVCDTKRTHTRYIYRNIGTECFFRWNNTLIFFNINRCWGYKK